MLNPTLGRGSFFARRTIRQFHSSRHLSEGLKILFCGSDKFSLRSLQAITNLKSTTKGCIESIDVLTKHEAPMGRGLTKQRLNPVDEFAFAHNIPNHKVDNLKEWIPPNPVDLIIAVSFGLFIPAGLLDGAKYGGWNIHPSFLPKYRGSAPIHHALLNGDESTGVVLQTLDKHKFDHGKIILKSSPVAINIRKTEFPEPAYELGSPYRNLEALLADEGGKLLIRAIADKLYDPAVQNSRPEVITGESRSMARKIPTERSLIRFGDITAQEVFNLGMVFDRVYCYLYDSRNHSEPGSKSSKRALMGPLRMPNDEDDILLMLAKPSQQWFYLPASEKNGNTAGMALRVGTDEWIVVKYLTIEGKSRKDADWWQDNILPEVHTFGV